MVLSSHAAGRTVLCAVHWRGELRAYVDECSVPGGDVAGDWLVEVTLNDAPCHAELVRVRCPAGLYEGAAGACAPCAPGMVCDAAAPSSRP